MDHFAMLWTSGYGDGVWKDTRREGVEVGIR